MIACSKGFLSSNTHVIKWKFVYRISCLVDKHTRRWYRYCFCSWLTVCVLTSLFPLWFNVTAVYVVLWQLLSFCFIFFFILSTWKYNTDKPLLRVLTFPSFIIDRLERTASFVVCCIPLDEYLSNFISDALDSFVLTHENIFDQYKYSRLSLSRHHLSRTTTYLEVKIWSLF